MKTWLITGCSTGLGRSLAEAVLERGDNAVVTARDAAAVQDLADSYPGRALAVALDVTKAEQVTAAATAATEKFGSIDVLVNNAGYGLRAAVEEASDADVELLFNTNVHGPVRLIKALLPGMRAARSGTIVNISSISAKVSPAGSGYYSASKAALEGITGSLRAELAPLGIRAFTVEPGGFRTDFAGRSLAQSATALPDYAGTAGKRRKENDSTHGTQPGDPARAAQALITAVDSLETPALLLLGTDALRAVRGVLTGQLAVIDEWEELSAGTDFPA